MYDGIYKEKDINILKKEILKWEIKYSEKKEEYDLLLKRYQVLSEELIRYKAKFGSLIDTKEPSKHK